MTNKSTCKHVDSLRTSLQDLARVKMGDVSSASKIRTDLTNIQTQLAALKGHSGGNTALSSQVNQLSSSVDQVKKASSGLSTPPKPAEITAVVTALTQLKAHSKAALVELDAACPK